MPEQILTVHTTAPINKQTGQQLCTRCAEHLHFVDLKSLPAPGPFGNALSAPEAHCYAAGVNVILQSPPIVLGEFKEGEQPAIGEFCQKPEKKK